VSVSHVLRCDECGEKLVYREMPEKDGWIEVWTDENTSFDFCDQQCLTDYFTEKEDDDE